MYVGFEINGFLLGFKDVMQCVITVKPRYKGPGRKANLVQISILWLSYGAVIMVFYCIRIRIRICIHIRFGSQVARSLFNLKRRAFSSPCGCCSRGGFSGAFKIALYLLKEPSTSVGVMFSLSRRVSFGNCCGLRVGPPFLLCDYIS